MVYRAVTTNVSLGDKVYCWNVKLQAHTWCPKEDAFASHQVGLGEYKLQ